MLKEIVEILHKTLPKKKSKFFNKPLNTYITSIPRTDIGIPIIL